MRPGDDIYIDWTYMDVDYTCPFCLGTGIIMEQDGDRYTHESPCEACADDSTATVSPGQTIPPESEIAYYLTHTPHPTESDEDDTDWWIRMSKECYSLGMFIFKHPVQEGIFITPRLPEFDTTSHIAFAILQLDKYVPYNLLIEFDPHDTDLPHGDHLKLIGACAINWKELQLEANRRTRELSAYIRQNYNWKFCPECGKEINESSRIVREDGAIICHRHPPSNIINPDRS